MHRSSPRVGRYLGEALLALLLATPACADDLRFQPYQEPESALAVSTSSNADGSFTTRVRADDPERWVYFDFQARSEAPPGDAGGAGTWDLAFQRFHIKSNGGASGDGGVRVAALPGAEFGALERAPLDGYLEDAADGDDSDENPDTPFEIGDGWYAYDPSNHTLSARPIVYALESAEGDYFKLEMLDYYDPSGNDARPSFRWASLEAP